MPNQIIDELIAAGVSSDTIVAVAKLIAEAEITAKIRAQTRDRVQRFRERKRDVTLPCVTVTLPPPAYTTPRRVSEPKRVLRHAKHSLPTDFELSESDNRHAVNAGWSQNRVDSELIRFRDHAAANDRRQADWHAAWRNWVSSPFNATKNGGTNGHHHAANPAGKTVSDVARELLAEHRARADEPPDGLLPPIRRQ